MLLTAGWAAVVGSRLEGGRIEEEGEGEKGGARAVASPPSRGLGWLAALLRCCAAACC